VFDKKNLRDNINKELINNFQKLIQEVYRWKKMGFSVALCHGCFDPLHVGHVYHFHAAKKMADKLIVTVTPDIFINKGINRPFIGQEHRLYMISELKVIDSAAINLWSSAINTIKNIKPDYFVKGSDYKDTSRCDPSILEEKEEIEKLGGKLLFTDEVTFSSTKLIEANAYERSINRKYGGNYG
jgi:cytidyltransferase-like protein